MRDDACHFREVDGSFLPLVVSPGLLDLIMLKPNRLSRGRSERICSSGRDGSRYTCVPKGNSVAFRAAAADGTNFSSSERDCCCRAQKRAS